MLNCSYAGHTGVLHESTGEVKFYGVLFRDILKAKELLDKIDPGYDYEPFTFRGAKGFVHEDGYVIVQLKHEPQWFSSIKGAKQWIKASTPMYINNVISRQEARSGGRLARAWF